MIHLVEETDLIEGGNQITIANKYPQWYQGKIKLPNRMTLTLETGSGQKWVAKVPRLKICHVIAHEAIASEEDLDSPDRTIRELIEAQRLRNRDGSWFTDAEGRYVYARPLLSFTGAEIGEDRTAPQQQVHV